MPTITLRRNTTAQCWTAESSVDTQDGQLSPDTETNTVLGLDWTATAARQRIQQCYPGYRVVTE